MHKQSKLMGSGDHLENQLPKIYSLYMQQILFFPFILIFYLFLFSILYMLHVKFICYLDGRLFPPSRRQRQLAMAGCLHIPPVRVFAPQNSLGMG